MTFNDHFSTYDLSDIARMLVESKDALAAQKEATALRHRSAVEKLAAAHQTWPWRDDAGYPVAGPDHKDANMEKALLKAGRIHEKLKMRQHLSSYDLEKLSNAIDVYENGFRLVAQLESEGITTVYAKRNDGLDYFASRKQGTLNTLTTAHILDHALGELSFKMQKDRRDALRHQTPQALPPAMLHLLRERAASFPAGVIR